MAVSIDRDCEPLACVKGLSSTLVMLYRVIAPAVEPCCVLSGTRDSV